MNTKFSNMKYSALSPEIISLVCAVKEDFALKNEDGSIDQENIDSFILCKR